MLNRNERSHIRHPVHHTEAGFAYDTFATELAKQTPLQTRLTNILRMIVQQTGAGKAAIYQVHDREVIPRRFRWPVETAVSSSSPPFERRNSLDALGIAGWAAPLSGRSVIAGTLRAAGSEREFLARDGAQSFLIVPIIMEETGWWGFIEIIDVREERTWPPEIHEFLLLLGDGIAKAIYEDEVNATINMSKTDLIELRLREEMLSTELEEIGRWKNQILSAFSHEFQTPLYTLLGFSKTLLENEELDSDKEIRMTCLQHIYDQSRRLEKLVNNLMFASRLHTKSLHIETHRIDFRTVLNAVRTWGEKRARTAQLDFYADVPKDLLQVTCDPGKIERMLQNILENAIANTPSPGWISMKVIPDSDNVVIIIADTGAGIPRERIGRIFEPFFSASDAASAESGVGLGLSIAKEIVDLHHGFISVESKEGEGSVFTITLPRNNKESVIALH